MENISKVKIAFTAALAAMSAVLGWFGWLLVAFVGCLALDYLTGSFAASKKGKWSSSKARSGLWHKLGTIVAVTVAAIADFVIGLIINNIPALELPFSYTVLFCPIVVVWYIFTELGSIVENAEKLGAPLPPFLRKTLDICKRSTESAWNNAFNDKIQ